MLYSIFNSMGTKKENFYKALFTITNTPHSATFHSIIDEYKNRISKKKFYKAIKENNYLLINQARQTGLTTMLLAYALANPDKKVLFYSHNQMSAEALASHLINCGYERIKHGQVANITFSYPTPNATCGRRFDYVFMDNGAFMDNGIEILTSVMPIISEDGKFIINSCPHGEDKFFFKLWVNSLLKRNQFKRLEVKHIFNPKGIEEKAKYMREKEFKEEFQNYFHEITYR